MNGKEIKSKYILESCIGQGNFGCVFKIKGVPYVMKLSLEAEMMAKEIKALIKMEKQKGSLGVSKLVDYGLIIVKNFDSNHKKAKVASFYVMPEYSMNLQ